MAALLETDLLESLAMTIPLGSDIDNMELDDKDLNLSFVVSWLHDSSTDCYKADIPIFDPQLIEPDTPEPENDVQFVAEFKSRSEESITSVAQNTEPYQQARSSPTFLPSGASSETGSPEEGRAFPGSPPTTATTIFNSDLSHLPGLSLPQEYQILSEIGDRIGVKIGNQFQKLQDVFICDEDNCDSACDAKYTDPKTDNILPQRSKSCEPGEGSRDQKPVNVYPLVPTTNHNGETVHLTSHNSNMNGTQPQASPKDTYLMNGVSTPIGFPSYQMNDLALPPTVVQNKENHFNTKNIGICRPISQGNDALSQRCLVESSSGQNTTNVIKILKEKLTEKQNGIMALNTSSVDKAQPGIDRGSLDIKHHNQDVNANIHQFGSSVGFPQPQHRQQQRSALNRGNQRLTVNISQAQAQYFSPTVHSAPVGTDLYGRHGMDYYNNGFPYPTTTTTCRTLPSLHSSPVGTMTAECYARQQQQCLKDATCYYRETQAATYSTESHLSGFNGSCVLPTDAFKMGFMDNMVFSAEGTSIPVSRGRVPKRRRSVSAVDVKQPCQGSGKSTGANAIPKLENDTTGYRYFLETPISTTQRIEEDKITYLNKGQFYGLTFDCQAPDRILGNSTVRSVIMVVFRDNKTIEDEMKAWEFWHSRQHSVKQRIIDIDTKNSCGIVPNSINEVAYNAVSVKWRPRESGAKIKIAINCLGTDFSYQKGVKGLPLHLQIDTFESVRDTVPQHRGYNQVKIFCDKGADRKTRDEERRKANRAKNGRDTGKKQEEIYHPPSNRSEFYAMYEREKIPVLFNPFNDRKDCSNNQPSPINGHGEMYGNGDEDEPSPSNNGEAEDRADDNHYPCRKRQRRDSHGGFREHPIISLYVKEPHEKGFTALMVKVPTLHGLLQAVEEKYGTPVAKVKNTYKRSKKGFLIKMDDNIVRHFTHESTVTIERNKVGDDDFDITLIEIDQQKSSVP